jgi:outer membrane protein TolC
MQGLPPAIQVAHALDQNLRVLEAKNNLQAELANQEIRDSGSHEFNLRAGSAQRRVPATGQQLKEWDVALERPFRLPNKIAIDRDIGAENVSAARAGVGDARHEASRTLLQLWFDLLRAHAQTGVWSQQHLNLTRQRDIVEKRYRAGDAPKIELNQAEAVAAQAAMVRTQQQLNEQLIAASLKASFPQIGTETLPETGTPQPINGNAAEWRQRILADNHELEMVQAQARAQQLLASRSRADRLADPTLGIRHSNEMGGAEKVTGVYVSLPFSFGQRGALATVASQQAEAAQARAAFVQRRLDSDIESAWLRAGSTFQRWEQARLASQIAVHNAELTRKAYQLGELGLTDTLNAGRLAMDAQLAEQLARLDANEARYRLLLDAHELWQNAHEDTP